MPVGCAGYVTSCKAELDLESDSAFVSIMQLQRTMGKPALHQAGSQADFVVLFILSSCYLASMRTAPSTLIATAYFADSGQLCLQHVRPTQLPLTNATRVPHAFFCLD